MTPVEDARGSERVCVVLKTIQSWLRKKSKKILSEKGLAGSITFIQRFGSHLGLNPHFPAIFPDGVFIRTKSEDYEFRSLPGPTKTELQLIVNQIYRKSDKKLSSLKLDLESGNIDGRTEALQLFLQKIQGHIKLQDKFIAIPNSNWTWDEDPYSAQNRGFSLNAKVAIPANKPEKLKKKAHSICRSWSLCHEST